MYAKRPLRFEAAAGLSLGEYTAHAAAGTFTFEAGLHLVEKRGALMQEACNATTGTMITLLGATPEQAQEIATACNVDVANLNCPGTGRPFRWREGDAKALPRLAKEKGIRKVIPLKVAGAYHSRPDGERGDWVSRPICTAAQAAGLARTGGGELHHQGGRGRG